MYIEVDPKSSVPLYSQIKDALRLQVATGVIQPGDQLPRVRELAERLRVNPNTVARAYRDLQSEGLLVARQGSGTFVSDEAAAIGAREQREVLQAMLDEAACTAEGLGLTREEFEEMARRAAQAVSPRADGRPDDNE
ncbi:MAG: GntR family transcriptional regulator [Armatimonadetes bacterium]|nr:GntR family transcriptional regulator [Armatimonadota bacterium]